MVVLWGISVVVVLRGTSTVAGASASAVARAPVGLSASTV